MLYVNEVIEILTEKWKIEESMKWKAFMLFIFYFLGRVYYYGPSCPETYYIEQAGIQFRNHPASASQVL